MCIAVYYSVLCEVINMKNTVKLCSVNDSYEADQIIGLLKNNNIPCYLNSGIMKVYSGNSIENDIFVALDDYKKAVKEYLTNNYPDILVDEYHIDQRKELLNLNRKNSTMAKPMKIILFVVIFIIIVLAIAIPFL